MFIKFTNLVEGFEGEPLIINSEHIISVYSFHEKHGSLSTRIYTVGNREFIVEESYYEVEKKLQNVEKIST